jgi:hypothetical protein
MATLAPGDFKNTSKKKASSGPYSGKSFQKIAALKIQSKKPFLLGSDGKKGSVFGLALTQVGDSFFLDFTKTKKSTTPDKESPLLISKFFKDKDFGGGGGSGGGAADTAINESLQCFYCSILFNTSASKLTPSNCTPEKLAAQAKYCFTQAKKNGTKYTSKNFVKELYEKAENKTPKASNWIEDKDSMGKNVYMRIAEKLYESNVAKPFKGKTVYFHRASPWMDAIYIVKERALDADKKLSQESRVAPLSGLSDDKWNPGDIWLSTIGDSSQNPEASGEGNSPLCYNNESKSDCSTFELLKDQVRINAKEGKLLGVSLKKVGSSAGLVEFNTKDRTQNINVAYRDFVFGQTGNFFSSADMYLHFSTGDTMQLRSTATTKSWQGEIKGKQASGGKIGGGGLNYYLEAVLKKSIGFDSIQGVKDWSEKKIVNKRDMYILYKKYNKMQKGDFKNVLPSVRIVDNGTPASQNLIKAYENLDNSQFRLIEEGESGYSKGFKQYIVKENSTTASQGYVNEKDFNILANNYISKGKNASPAFYFSKYMNLLFLDALYTASSNKKKGQTKDNYAKQIVRYAMSNTDISSYFIKIY